MQQGVRRLGVESDRIPVALYKRLAKRAEELGIALIATVPSMVDFVRSEFSGEPSPRKRKKVWSVDVSLTGGSAKDRLRRAKKSLEQKRLDGFVIVPLDEIAWLANLRGSHFPYQATFPSRAIAYRGTDSGEIVIEGPRAKENIDANVIFLGSIDLKREQSYVWAMTQTPPPNFYARVWQARAQHFCPAKVLLDRCARIKRLKKSNTWPTVLRAPTTS